MQLSQVCNAVNGRLLGADCFVEGVVIDSRVDCSNRLFVALVGDRFDGHDFVAQAQHHGAAAAIVEKPVSVDLPCICVNNSHQALTQLATWWRAQFVIPVVGVTGSVGKTSVKQMLACIFAELGKGLVTHGNLNNEIGVPLTLSRLAADDIFAIIEMGMNHAGELSRLTQMVKPTVALINNAAAAHLQGLGSVQAVARAKGEIFAGLSADGVAVINLDDCYAPLWRQLAEPRKVVTFGIESDANSDTESADVTARYQLQASSIVLRVKFHNQSAATRGFEVELSLIGKHNVMNALAAIAAAHAANVSTASIASGLVNFRPVHGRLQVLQLGELTLIDDSYNANPASMRAAIDVLAQFSNTTLILGDMSELGEASQQEHLRLGTLAQAKQLDRLLACGEFAKETIENFGGTAKKFSDQQQLLSFLSENPISTGAVLVKGSRAAKMEKVVEFIKQTQDDVTAKSHTSMAGER